MALHGEKGMMENPFDSLSDRELQVARGLIDGKRNSELASELEISIKTVDTHRGKALKKLNVRNNVELARLAVKHRIVVWEVLSPS
jgi:DNA-binding NarL/FixJ family response regulator